MNDVLYRRAVEIGASDGGWRGSDVAPVDMGSVDRRATGVAHPEEKAARDELLLDPCAVEVGAPDRPAVELRRVRNFGIAPVDVRVVDRHSSGIVPGAGMKFWSTFVPSRLARPIVPMLKSLQ